MEVPHVHPFVHPAIQRTSLSSASCQTYVRVQSESRGEGDGERVHHRAESATATVRHCASSAMGGARAVWQTVESAVPIPSLRGARSTVVTPAVVVLILLLLATKLLRSAQNWLKVSSDCTFIPLRMHLWRYNGYTLYILPYFKP